VKDHVQSIRSNAFAFGQESVRCPRVPAVDIIRTKMPSRKKRKLGTLKGKIQILDIDWWKPMSDDEADAFVEGRD
jgi:hypothetical protein